MGESKPEIDPGTEEEKPLMIPSYMVPLVPIVDRFLTNYVQGKYGPAKLLRKWKRERISPCDGT